MVDKPVIVLGKKILSQRFLILMVAFFIIVPVLSWWLWTSQRQVLKINQEQAELKIEMERKTSEITKSLQDEIDKLNNEDLRKTNKEVRLEIEKLKSAYKNTLDIYRLLLGIRESSNKTAQLDSIFASILDALRNDNLELVSTLSAKIKVEIDKETTRLATMVKIPENVVAKNEAPGSGYSRQKVTVGSNSYLVDIVAGDLNSTKVVVDTASDSTCTNDCPVLPLATYVARSGAYAGINGTYFCPETYPDCASKKNTFDVLVMNKSKTYFNSDNNVYSTVPVAVFSGGSARFIRESKDWGRDTGVDSVIANRPLLVLDGNAMFSGSGEPKEGARGNRSFLGSSGSTAYIGIVHGATVAESATVLHTMGIKNAINLDSGGSTALWSGGYKAGPGRNLPNAVLFVKK